MGWLVKVFVASIIFFLGFPMIKPAPKSDVVTKLPGFNGSFPSKHYAGYVNINKKSGKNLWYYFVESERNASSDPVVLWLNGGPGCSSMDGFIYEHGPFNFESTNTKTLRLHLNRYSWSKVSNIIYLDSPVGVGYSYSKNKSDYETNDTKNASDSHKFLIKSSKKNPFFIPGESYAGIYVPTLASQVVKGNKNVIRRNKTNKTSKKHKKVTNPVINFKGYLVGNGVTDEKFDGNALVPFAHGMGLISDERFPETKVACKENYYDRNQSKECDIKLSKVSEGVDLLNIYNILDPYYHEKTLSASDIGSLPPSLLKLGTTKRPMPVRKRMYGRARPLGAAVRPGIVLGWPQILADATVPCIDDRVASAWLNDPAVRKAVHGEKWRSCMCVPYTGSEAWTKSMGYKVIDEWRPWMSNGQVAGFIQGYENNLTFLTVKGSGHTVPEYKPHEALDFYSRFLAAEKI